MSEKSIRVAHLVDVFLTVSENWIFPQIRPDDSVTSAVVYRERANANLFPGDGLLLIEDPPGWSHPFSRLANSIAFRFGIRRLSTGRKLRRWRPQLLHAHFGSQGVDSLVIARELGIPLVTSFYGSDAWCLPQVEPKFLEAYRGLFQAGDLFVVEGPAMSRRLQELGCPEAKIQVVHIGAEFKDEPLRDWSRNPWRVLMMARFTEKKGLEDGLSGCIKAMQGGTNLEVIVAGGAGAGDPTGEAINERLRSLAGTSGFADRITFTGMIPPARADELLRTCEIFLCPSKHAANGDAEGGSPVVLTQAMAMGSYCIGTEHCDIPELIINNQTGRLIKEGDVDAIGNAIEEAVRNPKRIAEIGKAGAARTRREFSLADQRRRLLELYQERIER